MKTTDRFKEVVEQELRFRAFKDPMLAKALRKKKKNIDDCVNYILNTVKESKIEGYAEDEVFGMAVHYYSEDDIKAVPFTSSGQLIINRHVALTDKEVEELRQKARDQVISEEKAKMRKKPVKAKVDDKKPVKKDNELF